MQGQLRQQGALGAYGRTSPAHATYKCSVFVLPDVSCRANLPVLGLGTFVAGLLFNLMREWLGSVAFPTKAQGVFDLVVYGDVEQLPRWAW